MYQRLRVYMVSFSMLGLRDVVVMLIAKLIQLTNTFDRINYSIVFHGKRRQYIYLLLVETFFV